MSNREEAIRVIDEYKPKLNELRIRATRGDDDAAESLLRLMVEFVKKLAELGFQLTDERDEEGPGKLKMVERDEKI